MPPGLSVISHYKPNKQDIPTCEVTQTQERADFQTAYNG